MGAGAWETRGYIQGWKGSRCGRSTPSYNPPMVSFMGGSAWAMAQQISDGIILVSERTFKPFLRDQLDKLAFELDKLLREVRSEQPPLDATQLQQQRQRKISRLTSALSMLRSYQQRLR